MPQTKDKFAADSTKVSNQIKFELLGRRDRQALSRIFQEAEDNGDKNLEVSADSYDSDGFVKTILISIEA